MNSLVLKLPFSSCDQCWPYTPQLLCVISSRLAAGLIEWHGKVYRPTNHLLPQRKSRVHLDLLRSPQYDTTVVMYFNQLCTTTTTLRNVYFFLNNYLHGTFLCKHRRSWELSKRQLIRSVSIVSQSCLNCIFNGWQKLVSFNSCLKRHASHYIFYFFNTFWRKLWILESSLPLPSLMCRCSILLCFLRMTKTLVPDHTTLYKSSQKPNSLL